MLMSLFESQMSVRTGFLNKMSFFGLVCRAVFILPFSAGNTASTTSGITHDGSLAGIVLLTTAIAIMCEILIIGYTTNAKITTKFSIHLLILICLSVLAVVVCVGTSLYLYFRRTSAVSARLNICTVLRLRFLWLFCFGCIIYRALDLIYRVDCFVNVMDYSTERIVFDATSIVFYIVQTGVITHVSSYCFTSNIVIYYGLLVLFLTNISVICNRLASSLQTNDNDFNVSCYNSSLFSVIAEINPYVEPSCCEYSLIAILFITNLWPKDGTSSNQIDMHSLIYENLVNNSDPSSMETSYEEDPLLTTSSRKQTLRKYGSICVPIIIFIPLVILYCVRVSGVSSVELALTSCLAVESSIELFLIVKCFYSLLIQCKPRARTPSRNSYPLESQDYMLIASAVAAIAYYTVKLISNIFVFSSGDSYKLRSYSLFLSIVQIYFQTLFILQMKQYKISRKIPSWTSIEYTCLLLSIINLCSWAADTFIVSRYVFVPNDVVYEFYGQKLWKELFEFLYPFVTFYRFSAYVFFYGLYTEMSS